MNAQATETREARRAWDETATVEGTNRAAAAARYQELQAQGQNCRVIGAGLSPVYLVEYLDPADGIGWIVGKVERFG
jgi:hypothetical protein